MKIRYVLYITLLVISSCCTKDYCSGVNIEKTCETCGKISSERSSPTTGVLFFQNMLLKSPKFYFRNA